MWDGMNGEYSPNDGFDEMGCYGPTLLGIEAYKSLGGHTWDGDFAEFFAPVNLNKYLGRINDFNGIFSDLPRLLSDKQQYCPFTCCLH